MSQPPHLQDRPAYLAVDGGGTKTLAVVADAQGRELGRGLAGSCNHRAVGLARAVARLHAAVEQAMDRAGCDLPTTAAWFGLAGLDRPGDADALLPRLAHFAASIRLTNDAELVLGGLEEHAGVALIAGTGSIALGRDAHGRVARVGGWGHLVGDEGSGYDIGRRALQAALRMADGRAERSMLLDRVLAHFSVARHADLLEPIYRHHDKARIAALAGVVLRAAEEGDAAARAIVRTAVEELAMAALAVAPTGECLALALGGGLLVHEPRFRAAVVRRSRRKRRLGGVVVVAEPAVTAARALAILHERRPVEAPAPTKRAEDTTCGG